MLKQKYFLTDFFILSAEKQPIKSSWRKIEWLLEEIALEIRRSTQYLKGEIIPVMVNKGLLEKEHAMPNHPAQRYKRKF